MKSATHVFYDTSEDTKLQELTRLREKSYNDMVNSLTLAERKGIEVGEKRGISIGVKRGREEGISIGRTETINEIINKLLKHGMSQAEIDVILKEQP